MMGVAQNSLLCRVLRGERVERPPVWIMRQAGRYLPEYRELRKQARDFMHFCQTPKWAAEATLQPLRRFDLDAGIIFSDILTIPDAMGLGVYFVPGQGPHMKTVLSQSSQLDNIDPDALQSRLGYVGEAIELTRSLMNPNTPLIGFAGSPWTLLCYMFEGKSVKDFPTLRKAYYQEPKRVHAALDYLVPVIAKYLLMQVKAGADVLMIFDSWGGLLPEFAYIDASLNPVKRIIEQVRRELKEQIPIILFSKGAGGYLSSMAECDVQGLGLDWTLPLAQARQTLGDKSITLQGNLDPYALYGNKDQLHKSLDYTFGNINLQQSLIVNLGHGISPDIDPERVEDILYWLNHFNR